MSISTGTRLRFGPSTLPSVTHVGRQTTLVISFVTTSEAAEYLLPPCFHAADRPVVSFTYQQLEDVDYMRGRGYNLVNVSATARFDRADGPMVRACPVVIWENNTMPIIAGRELHGNPKIFGDITDLDRREDQIAYECEEYGSSLIRGEANELRPLDSARLARVNNASQASTIFGWKSIPGSGTPDADYPTLIHGSTVFEQGWSGTGRVEFGHPSEDDAPYSSHVIRALREVPQVEQRPAFLGIGTATLFRDRTERLA